MFTPTNCLDVLLLVAIIIPVTSYSRDIGSISKDKTLQTTITVIWLTVALLIMQSSG